MEKISFILNAERATVTVAPDTPLLWVIRDHLNLTGTKYGCGKGLCGSCTLHMNDTAIRSCITPVGSCDGKKITTIEGLSKGGDHPLQAAWRDSQVPQCGYCQSGQIMQAAILLDRKAAPSRDEIKEHMKGNICRCGTYLRILNAIESASQNQG